MSEVWRPPARHLVLIATQCAAMPELPDLTARADRLFDVLTDPRTGRCEPSPAPAGDAAHLRSGSVTWREADEAIRAAVRVAARAGATLVLAFLGHGQTPLAGGKLWYMAADSLPDEADRSLDVAALLELASDATGATGVIALIDTCHAGAGVPNTAALAGGFRNGSKRLSVLMACGSQQEAYRLDFSHELAEALSEGIPDEGEMLRTGALKLRVGPRLKDQDVQNVDFDGDADAEEPLWLALNRLRRPWTQNQGIGAIGAEDLAEALRNWPGGPATPDPWSREALTELSERALDPSGPPAARWAAEVAEGLVAAIDTGSLLVDLAGSALTTPLLRRLAADFNRQWAADGIQPVRPPGGLTGRALLRHLLEHAALRTPSVAGTVSPDLALAWYVVAVADTCGSDLSDTRVRRWARNTADPISLNDARERYERNRRERALRLVISLHAAQVDWPDSLSACLRDGPGCLRHEHFPCRPDRTGVEAVLPDVIAWAYEASPGRAEVGHVDIVATAPVLLNWRPEQALVDQYLLGTHRTVTLRWSGRLVVPAGMRGLNERARAQLETLRQDPLESAPVDWLDQERTVVAQLMPSLARGKYGRAIGVGHRPSHLQELVTALLPYTPILFWPDTEGDVDQAARSRLGQVWERLPEVLNEAQRQSWDEEDDGCAEAPDHLGPLACLRAAWHDTDWFDFCDTYEQHAPFAPRST
ncbi:hypothetical protein ACFWP2_15965 [Kitasatospora sp. NPDC058444]|uniref:vWA-MoxR associated conflict system protein n=1 Tax=Kitasatospora sp. NPDC058444 TaxID=3346504 RepID=UPI003655922E